MGDVEDNIWYASILEKGNQTCLGIEFGMWFCCALCGLFGRKEIGAHLR